ncbi:DUF2997 domain-containing protein [Novipirellula rosea]|uniref:DUF2997 domain-containing protein n=1 Tax=Novipirellula rosea TaxID=1031540 RepID=A0ABP8MDR0_9BACT
MKTIQITVAPSGETKVETSGFSGSECREASQFLEAALGARRSETITAEFYADQSQSENQTQREG